LHQQFIVEVLNIDENPPHFPMLHVFDLDFINHNVCPPSEGVA